MISKSAAKSVGIRWSPSAEICFIAVECYYSDVNYVALKTSFHTPADFHIF